MLSPAKMGVGVRIRNKAREALGGGTGKDSEILIRIEMMDLK